MKGKTGGVNMVGEGIEAMGDLATGGLAARAVEPKAGEAGHGPAEHCLNCGSDLVGEFCHRCGQHGHVHRSLAAWWHDLAHGVLHLDGKVWRTLPLLAWRPGELTRRYVEGERAKFVSPMALFLFSVFLMFAVFSTLGGPFATNFNGPDPTEIASERDQAKARLAELERQRAAAPAGSPTAAKADEQIAEVRQEVSALDTVSGSNDVNISGPEWVNHAVEKARANPSLLIYKLQNNAYKFSWALIPISVPFVALLFLFRRRFRMYDHTVFVTYSIAFMTLFLVALSLLRVAGISAAWIGTALGLVPPIHMYRQLRRGYELSRFSALWRTAMLLVFSLVAAPLFFTLLLGLGVA